jgi:hypothetical protein
MRLPEALEGTELRILATSALRLLPEAGVIHTQSG